jgi:CRP/FNR family cyclic AMP-dependent transcriptional regulator
MARVAPSEIASLLGEAELFEGFDQPELDRLAAAAEARTLRRNDAVFAERDDANELFVVRSGRIVISIASPDGRESVMALMEAGDLFGEMGLFVDGARTASARALEPSEVVAVPYPLVHERLTDRPELLWGVVRLLARRLRATDVALADSMFLDVTGRTAKRLLELAGDAEEFTLPITQEELAGMVGASRERVNKALAAFVRLGWLEQAERRYRIVDREQLTRRAR